MMRSVSSNLGIEKTKIYQLKTYSSVSIIGESPSYRLDLNYCSVFISADRSRGRNWYCYSAIVHGKGEFTLVLLVYYLHVKVVFLCRVFSIFTRLSGEWNELRNEKLSNAFWGVLKIMKLLRGLIAGCTPSEYVWSLPINLHFNLQARSFLSTIFSSKVRANWLLLY